MRNDEFESVRVIFRMPEPDPEHDDPEETKSAELLLCMNREEWFALAIEALTRLQTDDEEAFTLRRRGSVDIDEVAK